MVTSALLLAHFTRLIFSTSFALSSPPLPWSSQLAVAPASASAGGGGPAPRLVTPCVVVLRDTAAPGTADPDARPIAPPTAAVSGEGAEPEAAPPAPFTWTVGEYM